VTIHRYAASSNSPLGLGSGEVITALSLYNLEIMPIPYWAHLDLAKS
jgi:hypothetical protein